MKAFHFIMTLLRWGLAGVFLWAGITKLLDPAAFAANVAQFKILPPLLVNGFALALPVFEILSALMLLAGPWRRQAALNIALLNLMFLIALSVTAARGITVQCHCFGSASAEPLWVIMARDVVFLITAMALYARELAARKSTPR